MNIFRFYSMAFLSVYLLLCVSGGMFLGQDRWGWLFLNALVAIAAWKLWRYNRRLYIIEEIQKFDSRKDR